MKIQHQTTKKKIELLLSNEIYFSSETTIPFPFERSTAGPSTYKKTITLQLNTSTIKLPVSNNPSAQFSLHQENSQYHIMKNNTLFFKNVKPLHVPYHAPNQAFLNISNQCIHNCGFCALSTCHHRLSPCITSTNINKIITKTQANPKIKGYAFTGGVYPNQKHHIQLISQFIQQVRKNNPTIAIGVEPTIQSTQEIQTLYDAGATEIKINIQTSTPQQFHCLCPGFSYEHIGDMLEHAVDLFGKGKVCSNIIYGLGETKEELLSCTTYLSTLGVVPTLRLIRTTALIKKELEKRLRRQLVQPSVEYIFDIACNHKNLLEENNLTTKSFQTMCHACESCDIVPFKDV